MNPKLNPMLMLRLKVNGINIIVMNAGTDILVSFKSKAFTLLNINTPTITKDGADKHRTIPTIGVIKELQETIFLLQKEVSPV